MATNGQTPAATTQPDCSAALAAVRKAAADGRLAWKLSGVDELKDVLGEPRSESERRDGGMLLLQVEFRCGLAVFGRMAASDAPYTLLGLTVGPVPEGWKGADLPPGAEIIDIGRDRSITLRNADDLKKFNDMWGVAGVSLAKLDLTGQEKLLRAMTFDTRTAWPPAERLPAGFDPDKILQDGKDPGLGIRGLHRLGINGAGVHIAIIDQPHAPNHIEYGSQIEQYKEIGVAGVPPQMHGPPVASIAVGKTCGVAPAARLWYYAVPMWKADNTPYCDAMDDILAYNEKAKAADRIRAVSISTGMFLHQEHYDRWQQTMRRAAEAGLLVITCAQGEIRYGTAGREPGAGPNDPRSYRPGKYGTGESVLLVPADNRTTASHHGPKVYTYWAEGGMSWAAPYLAGVAVLGYQINPDLKPQDVLDALRNSAAVTDAGHVVNPVGFIEAIRPRDK
ncbi:MAG: S8/S53 family peptidase [Phycisphaerales bacterium]|nr:MAG: S8/S53 family peptidase [Phycisphaerales bacterium]